MVWACFEWSACCGAENLGKARQSPVRKHVGQFTLCVYCFGFLPLQVYLVICETAQKIGVVVHVHQSNRSA